MTSSDFICESVFSHDLRRVLIVSWYAEAYDVVENFMRLEVSVAIFPRDKIPKNSNVDRFV